MRKLTTGMFSYQEREVRHRGQCEAGKTMEPFSMGNRRMTTLRKLPIIAPKSRANKSMRVKGSIVYEGKLFRGSGRLVEEDGAGYPLVVVCWSNVENFY
jgi:hypothetical protein